MEFPLSGGPVGGAEDWVTVCLVCCMLFGSLTVLMNLNLNLKQERPAFKFHLTSHVNLE